jgi:protein tyrosine phosphatase type 4A
VKSIEEKKKKERKKRKKINVEGFSKKKIMDRKTFYLFNNDQNYRRSRQKHKYQLQSQPILSNLIAPINIIQYNKRFKFIVTECPSMCNFEIYLKILNRENCNYLIEINENWNNNNNPELFDLYCNKYKILKQILYFEEGSVPTNLIIDKWVYLLESIFMSSSSLVAIAVMCESGLGCGPLLIAIAFIEWGENYFAVINYIRSIRYGAFNYKQVKFLQEYKPRSKILNSTTTTVINHDSHDHGHNHSQGCVIM